MAKQLSAYEKDQRERQRVRHAAEKQAVLDAIRAQAPQLHRKHMAGWFVDLIGRCQKEAERRAEAAGRKASLGVYEAAYIESYKATIPALLAEGLAKIDPAA